MTNSARLGPMFDAAAGETEDLASFDGPAAELISQLPWAVPPSDPRVWAHRRDLDPTVRRLAEEYVAGQIHAVASTGEALLRLAGDESLRAAADDRAQRPSQLVGRVLRPDGVPAERLQVSFGRGVSASASSPRRSPRRTVRLCCRCHRTCGRHRVRRWRCWSAARTPARFCRTPWQSFSLMGSSVPFV